MGDNTFFDEGGSDTDFPDDIPVNQQYLTAIFTTLYNGSSELFGDAFQIFGNLEEV